jgi:ABC-type transport system substrate-binding protein
MKRLVFLCIVLVLLSAIIMTGCTSTTSTTSTSTTTQSSTTSKTTSTSVTTKTTAPTTSTSVTTKTTATNQPQSGGTIRYACKSPSNPFGIPWLSSGATSYTYQLCLESLLSDKKGSDMSRLATSYKIDADSSTPSITFYLRKGVKFHDGTDFNAKAVKWNFEKMMGKDSLQVADTVNWKSIDILDDYTIKLSVTTWQNTMLFNFTQPLGFMISPTAFEKNGLDNLKYNMVGTGPFMQKEYKKDASITVVKNPNYWDKGKPYVDQIQLIYYADEMTAQALFKTGQCELLVGGRSMKMAFDLAAEGYQTLVQPTGYFAMWPDSINADSPWSNIKVRQAVEYAIDKKAMAKTFGYGYLNALYQFCPPGTLGYDASLPEKPFDVAKAKQLMAEAGFSGGFNTTLIMNPTVPDENMAVAIQSYLAAIGIKAEIQKPSRTGYAVIWSGPQAGWKNACLLTTANVWDNPNINFDGYLSAEQGASYPSVKKPTGFRELLIASLATAEPDPELLKKMERAIYDDVTLIFIMDSSVPFAIGKNVMDPGLATHTTNSYWDPQNVWLKK